MKDISVIYNKLKFLALKNSITELSYMITNER